MKQVVVSAEELTRLCIACLVREQVPADHAAIVAEVLVHANLRGVDSHGVLRMEHYVRRVRAGGMNVRPDIRIRPTGLVTAMVDGDDGFGHVVARTAMDHAVSLAEQHGVGMVGVHSSSHCGALSYFVQRAAQRGMIGWMMTHTDTCIVPFGSAAPYFGTNPLAFGFPANNQPPIIIDMATSQVAWGKVLQARQSGTAVPDDWGVDQEGRATTDPQHIAALLPFGGPKGSALALIVDIFSGMLTGSAFGTHVSKMYGDYEQKRKLGHFLCAVNISSFTDRDSFLGAMERMAAEIHALPPAAGQQRVMLPGELEQERERERRLHGIPLAEEVYRFLRQQDEQ